jgi:hypothetical protein
MDPFNVSETSHLDDHFDKGGVVVLKLDPAVNDNEHSDMVGRMLKRSFFKYCYKRQNINRPMAYFVDEAHRFITGDRETGEHSFVDRCRSFNVMCFFASQSIQSLNSAIAAQSGSQYQDNVKILLSNTATKYFFGSSDTTTQNYIEQIVQRPPRSDLPSVAEVRPLSSLSIGECYKFSFDGTFDILSHKLTDLEAKNQMYKDQLTRVTHGLHPDEQGDLMRAS